jgi:hypothetical protein
VQLLRAARSNALCAELRGRAAKPTMAQMGLPDGASTEPPRRPRAPGEADTCSYRGCTAVGASPCSYVDRRQRRCPTAWCGGHQQVAFSAVYCRRHAGIIEALGTDHAGLPLPDLDNRAPSLANWVGRDLDAAIRTLLATGFPSQAMNVTSMVSGGSPRDRSWGRSWKVISPLGVDCSVSVAVLEADDSVVRVAYDGKEILAVTPPWIESRRRGLLLDAVTDHEQRSRFHDSILEALEDAVMAAKQRRNPW